MIDHALNNNWDDRLLTGHSVIDAQHKSLFVLASYITHIEIEQASKSFAGEVLCQLADYAKDHFALEEYIMRVTKFPICAEHIVEHWDFIQRMASIIDRYERGNDGILLECRQFVSAWLENHISVSDMLLACHISGDVEFANELRQPDFLQNQKGVGDY